MNKAEPEDSWVKNKLKIELSLETGGKWVALFTQNLIKLNGYFGSELSDFPDWFAFRCDLAPPPHSPQSQFIEHSFDNKRIGIQFPIFRGKTKLWAL